MSVDPLYVVLGELYVQDLCPFFNWIVCLPGVELCEFYTYFGDQTLVQNIIGKYIFLYSFFLIHLADVFFSCSEALYSDEVHLFILSFMSLALVDTSVKILLHAKY